MDSETIDAVTEWETVTVDDGYRGLHRLADAEFTGAVTDGFAWAFALNGRVVGVFEGSVESFEGTDLTAYGSPDPALPLLYAMRERGGETQAKYYTKEMSLSEADETLRSGGFTGYVRLSENVLSGDYYVVYYGGKSMSVAFVGNNRRLLAGDEAFERANDEVGIYEVVDVDVDVVELPDAPEPEPDADPAPSGTIGTPDTAQENPGASADGDDASSAGAAGDPTVGSEDRAEQPTPGVTFSESDADDGSTARGASTTGDEPDDPARRAESSTDEHASDADTPRDATDAPSETAAAEATDATPGRSDDGGRASTEAEMERPRPTDEDGDDGTASVRSTGTSERAAASPNATPETSEGSDHDDSVFTEEEEWREARAIPSLDPTQTGTESAGRPGQGRSDDDETRSRGGAESSSTDGPRRQSPSESRSESGSTASPAKSRSSTRIDQSDSDDAARLRERLEDAESERDRLAEERDELEAAREEVAAERDEYRKQAERLESRVADLEAEIDELESRLDETADDGGGPASGRTMSAAEALTGTNLFVRYASKADPTLEDAHGGRAHRDEVNDNLRLEHHTQFDTDDLEIDGEPFEEFLRDTVEYRFVDWIVRDVLYDVQATRARNELQELYDVVPRIDRVEIDGTVSVQVGEGEGESTEREEETFDVVLWDGRGDPLLVANLNTTRDPATESMVSSLVTDARTVGEAYDSLGAAFYVTASYYEPGALDAVGDATGGGLLSRSKRRSFVKLARKQGFHLCLVEARNREFHVSVPDL